MARDIIDISVKAWLCFYSSSPPNYTLKTRICNYIEIANYPLIQIGASWFPGAGESLLGMAEVLATVPKTIAQNSQVPYCDLSGTWVCPEDIQLDYGENPVRVSPGDFGSPSIMPWTIPTFWECTLHYIGSGGSLSTIPGSITGMDKQDVGSNGTIFTPKWIQLLYSEEVIADRYVDDSSSAAWGRWAFFYEGQNLREYHIWENYTYYFPISGNYPWVWNPSIPCFIEDYLSYAYGYTPRINYYSGGYNLLVDVYKNDTLPAIYYPRGGTPRQAPISPIIIAAPLLLGIIGEGLIGIKPAGIELIINGISLSINGIPLTFQ